ncbi:MAG: hypothetical protein LBK05_09470 [Treponema sp.]|jgi:hypothetical protein|nr:hypothetical protein [Treponema sp.]
MKMYFFPLLAVLVWGGVSCASNKTASFVGENDDFLTDDSGAGSVALGNVDVGIIKAFSSKVAKESAAAVYDGTNDIVTLEFQSAGGTHNRQYWTARARDGFIGALAQYEASYEARDLPRGFLSSGKRNVYGKSEILIHWWALSFSNRSRGQSRLDFGYLFKDRNPYFTVTQNEAKDTYVNPKNNSAQVTLYFTRAMAQELAALFAEENLYASISRQ